jgi:hypothetical protein
MNMLTSRGREQSKMNLRNNGSLGRKRSRVCLATFASALAISVTAVGAFQFSLPHHPQALSPRLKESTPGEPLYLSKIRLQSTRLSVAVDPEIFLREHVELRSTAPLARPLNGATTVQRKVPPKIHIKTRSTPKLRDDGITARKAQTISVPRSSVALKSSTTALPERKKKKHSKRQTSTMPGFQTGSLTGRQKAFRDGIKMVERNTGKKISAALNTPEQVSKRRQMNGEAMYKTSASVPDSLVRFANEIHKVDRITPKEEIELGQRTQEAIRLQSLHEDLTVRLDRPPTDEEWCAAAGKINLEAISQAIEEGLDAKNKLVTANLRMVQGVVNLYIRNGLSGQYNAGDLMQEGIMVCYAR